MSLFLTKIKQHIPESIRFVSECEDARPRRYFCTEIGFDERGIDVYGWEQDDDEKPLPDSIYVEGAQAEIGLRGAELLSVMAILDLWRANYLLLIEDKVKS
jgi:hypothetical protein